MKRRAFIKQTGLAAAGVALLPNQPQARQAEEKPAAPPRFKVDPTLVNNWLMRWEAYILADLRNRYCDHETGEEIGWLISPFLSGFYSGYMATRNPKWVAFMADWADSWIKRAVTEPDGFIGWPKTDSGGMYAKTFLTDSLLGEAMGLSPLALMAGEIQKSPDLKEKFGKQADAWLALSARMFDKWESRSCWRNVNDGGLWVVPDFGIDPATGHWSDGYARRGTEGFSNPDNKENAIASWMLAMHKVTGKPTYRERAEKWFRLMKSRMVTRAEGKYFVWNYWDPAGSWDYKADHTTRHWVGVHPNGGYYGIDVGSIVGAFEHGLVFTREDIDRLIATNRDFMWNHQIKSAKFQRIDGNPPDPRWKDSPGVLWLALAPYDETLRQIFIENNNPGSWGGIQSTPWFIAKEAGAL
jgi:hypothetical protein